MKKIFIAIVMLTAVATTCITLMSVTKTTSSNGEIIQVKNNQSFNAFAMEDSDSF